MEKLYLKFPTMEDKEKWIDYLKEFRNDNPESKPLGCDEFLNYEAWLEKISNDSKGINLKPGRVPTTVYFLMHDDKIIGNLTIRHSIDSEFLRTYGGHIGYGIRPSERKKGYATIMLHMALEECQKLGLTDVMVTCKESNIGSAKTIENNFGVQTELVNNPEENINYKKYWINIEESLKKYENSNKINCGLKM